MPYFEMFSALPTPSSPLFGCIKRKCVRILRSVPSQRVNFSGFSRPRSSRGISSFCAYTASSNLLKQTPSRDFWINLRLRCWMMGLRILLPVLLLGFDLATTVFAQSSTPENVCETKNGTSCEECLKNVTCLWCITTKSCITYPVKTILPPHALCPLNDARWGLCWMNFQILIITLSVLGAVLIIGFLVCLFCCCKCENFGSQRFEAKMHRQANKLKTKQEERRAEMKQRHQEIRQKYGLSGQNPYSKFS